VKAETPQKLKHEEHEENTRTRSAQKRSMLPVSGYMGQPHTYKVRLQQRVVLEVTTNYGGVQLNKNCSAEASGALEVSERSVSLCLLRVLRVPAVAEPCLRWVPLALRPDPGADPQLPPLLRQKQIRHRTAIRRPMRRPPTLGPFDVPGVSQ
jgi:hypothetical protein